MGMRRHTRGMRIKSHAYKKTVLYLRGGNRLLVQEQDKERDVVFQPVQQMGVGFVDMVIDLLLRHAQLAGNVLAGLVVQPVKDEDLAGLFGQFVQSLHDKIHDVFRKDRAIAAVFEGLDAGCDFPVMQLCTVTAIFDLYLEMLQVVQAFMLDGLQDVA